MRVIAGTARGRRISAPPGQSVRPTTDRVRQATFNALVHRGVVDGAQVVDLFAGSGALGIEALSRGAAHVTFVESDRVAQRFIAENLQNLGFTGQSTIVKGDAMRWAATTANRFGLAFLDPPYTFDQWPQLLHALARGPLCPSEDDLPIAMFETHTPLELSKSWVVERQQRYGGTVVTLASPTGNVSEIPDA